MTKRLLALLLCLALVVSLVGCGKKSVSDTDTVNPAMRSDLTLRGDHKIVGNPIKFSVGSIGVVDVERDNDLTLRLLITSRSDIEKNQIENEYTKKYDDEFFKTNNLIYVLFLTSNEKRNGTTTITSIDNVTLENNIVNIYATTMTEPGLKPIGKFTAVCVEIEKSSVSNVDQIEFQIREYIPTYIIEKAKQPVTPPVYEINEEEINVLKDTEVVGTPIDYTLAANGFREDDIPTRLIMVKNSSELLDANVDEIYNISTVELGYSERVKFDWRSKYTEEFFKTKNLLVVYRTFSSGREFYPGKIDSVTIEADTLYLNTTMETILWATTAPSTVTILIELEKSDVENINDIVLNERLVTTSDFSMPE